MSHDIYHFEMRDKGRSVLPAGLRRACGFEVGTELTAWRVGPGKAIIETRQALLEDLWSSPRDDGGDGVEELAHMRLNDAERLTARTTPSWPEGVDEPAADEDIDTFLRSLVR